MDDTRDGNAYQTMSIDVESASDFKLLHNNIRSFHENLKNLNSVFQMKAGELSKQTFFIESLNFRSYDLILTEEGETIRKLAHDNLGHVLHVLKEILETHPNLNSNALVIAVLKLIKEIRGKIETTPILRYFAIVIIFFFFSSLFF